MREPYPLFRLRDYVSGVLLLLFFPNLFVLQRHPLEGSITVFIYTWLLILAIRNWWHYQRQRRPLVKAHALTTHLLETLSPSLGQGYTFQPLTTHSSQGSRIITPAGVMYHVYPLAEDASVTPGEWVSTPEQRQLAGQEEATLLLVNRQGGPPLAQGHEVVLFGGLSQLGEQVAFWEEARHLEDAARERGREVEAQALTALETAFPGWGVRRNLLMRRGGDVDAVLTRPDGTVFSVDVKSHRGAPTLHGGVLHFGRDEKGEVQAQLHLQARETGGQAVCWQPDASYGVRDLDGLRFVGGTVSELQQALSHGAESGT